MIGIPCYGGHMFTQCCISLLKLQKKLQFEIETVTFDSLVPRARNAIVTKFLNSTCDRLLFIDSDIVFEPDDVFALLDKDLPVICGMYPKKSICPNMVRDNVVGGKDDILKFSSKLAINIKAGGLVNDTIIELLDAPTGFMCIKKEVFENLKSKVQSYYSDISGYPYKTQMFNFFGIGVQHDRFLSEDYWFCRLCQENGISVYGHLKVILKHIGTYVFT